MADVLENSVSDFDQHEAIFLQLSSKRDSLMGVFLHQTLRGQGAGGVRIHDYGSFNDFLRDGLRLSSGMTEKNSLAQLWWGGGKGVIWSSRETMASGRKRKVLFQEFGTLVTSLNGCYVAAEDLGTTQSDMEAIFSKTRFTTCIPPKLGGSGNPSLPTARGVVAGMRASLAVNDAGSLEGKKIVVQGLGHVGLRLVERLLQNKVGHIFAGDCRVDQVDVARGRFPADKVDVEVVDVGDQSLLARPCDILSPCAFGGVLNKTTIPSLRTSIVCGAANNQLEDPVEDDQLLYDRRIQYVPDFLTNRMGIVTCSNEQYGYVENDTEIEKHLHDSWQYSIFKLTQEVLRRSAAENQPTGRIARQMASEFARVQHPIFGHRAQEIIRSLCTRHWETEGESGIGDPTTGAYHTSH